MESEIIEVLDLAFRPDGLVECEAVVDQMVITRGQSYEEPAEWGPAVCRGSFYLCEDDVIPATDAGVRRLFSERISNWEIIDTTDWEDDGADD